MIYKDRHDKESASKDRHAKDKAIRLFTEFGEELLSVVKSIDLQRVGMPNQMLCLWHDFQASGGIRMYCC